MSDTSPKIDSVQVSASAVVEPPLVTLTKQDNTKPTETKVDTSKPLAGKPKVIVGDKSQEKALKALKDERRAVLDGRHEFLFSRLADSCGIEISAVEDMVLGDDKFDQIESFFAANGRKMLMFYYQEFKTDTTAVNFGGRPVVTTNKKKLVISTGLDEQLIGSVYYFLRTSNSKNISVQSIANEVNFGVIDASNGKLLDSVEKMLRKVLLPALVGLEDWGSLKTKNNPQVQDYVETLDNFVNNISGLKNNMSNQVKLVSSDQDAQLNTLTTVSDFQHMSMNGEFLTHCEELLSSWCKQIAKVLTESEQIRREADDTGPYSELAYWKQRMANFNNLLEQIKSQRLKAVVGVLQAAKSKSLDKWKEMDSKITDAANESRENVKYLYTLDKFFSSMTKASPTAITESIPSLMNAVRMIHSISQYYNSSERMTSLFLK